MLAQLNTMEKVLLIIFLKGVKDDDSAMEIFNSIDCENKLIKYDTKTFKKLFDTVLNSKSNMDATEINKKPEELLDMVFANPSATTTSISNAAPSISNFSNINSLMQMNMMANNMPPIYQQ